MKTNFLLAAIIMFIGGAISAQDKKADPAKLVPASMTTTPAAAVTPPPAAVMNPNAPEFKFTEEEFNFGTIKQGESITHEFDS